MHFSVAAHLLAQLILLLSILASTHDPLEPLAFPVLSFPVDIKLFMHNSPAAEVKLHKIGIIKMIKTIYTEDLLDIIHPILCELSYF